jgi:hypothetical protein
MRPLLGVKYNFNLNLNLSVRPGCLVSDLDVLAGGGLLGASAVGVVVLLTTTRGLLWPHRAPPRTNRPQHVYR